MQRCAIRREPDSPRRPRTRREPERRADGNSFPHDLTRIGETEDIDLVELLDEQQVAIGVAD
jgi:hypothetical protein